jgi:PRC-barrel domain
MAAEEPQEEPAQQQAQGGGQQQQGGQQQVTEAQQPTEEHPLTAMPASEVIGTEVVNAEGDQVAEIVDLVKEQGQGEVMAVLSVGGFLGVGDKRVVVPLGELDVAPDNQIIAASMTEEEVKTMPAYDEARYESTLEEVPASAPASGQQQ